jgi:hypothetical protein
MLEVRTCKIVNTHMWSCKHISTCTILCVHVNIRHIAYGGIVLASDELVSTATQLHPQVPRMRTHTMHNLISREKQTSLLHFEKQVFAIFDDLAQLTHN